MMRDDPAYAIAATRRSGELSAPLRMIYGELERATPTRPRRTGEPARHPRVRSVEQDCQSPIDKPHAHAVPGFSDVMEQRRSQKLFVATTGAHQSIVDVKMMRAIGQRESVNQTSLFRPQQGL